MIKSSQDIVHQRVKVVVDMGDPELGVGLVDFVWNCDNFVELFLVPFLLLELFLSGFLIPLPLLFYLYWDWLIGLIIEGLSLFGLELGLGAVVQEDRVGRENVLLLEHYLVARVLLHLVPCQVLVRLGDVHCYHRLPNLLEQRGWVRQINYFPLFYGSAARSKSNRAACRSLSRVRCTLSFSCVSKQNLSVYPFKLQSRWISTGRSRHSAATPEVQNHSPQVTSALTRVSWILNCEGCYCFRRTAQVLSRYWRSRSLWPQASGYTVLKAIPQTSHSACFLIHFVWCLLIQITWRHLRLFFSVF